GVGATRIERERGVVRHHAQHALALQDRARQPFAGELVVPVRVERGRGAPEERRGRARGEARQIATREHAEGGEHEGAYTQPAAGRRRRRGRNLDGANDHVSTCGERTTSREGSAPRAGRKRT